MTQPSKLPEPARRARVERLCAAAAPLLAAVSLLAAGPGDTNAPPPTAGDDAGSSTNRASADPGTNSTAEASSANTPAPSAEPSAPSGPAGSDTSFAAFKDIAELNIFNPNRRPPRPAGSGRRAPRPLPDAFTLVGTMLYEKGNTAFFDARKEEYKKALKVGGEIVGYKIASIGMHKIKLAGPTNEWELKVGMGMHRDATGAWAPGGEAGSGTSRMQDSDREDGAEGTADAAADGDSRDAAGGKTAEASSAGAASAAKGAAPGAADPGDVLKRLMQRRQQQIKP